MFVFSDSGVWQSRSLFLRLFMSQTHTHTHTHTDTHSGPRHGMWGTSFRTLPAALSLRCRPPVGQPLATICIPLEPQEGCGAERMQPKKKSIHCVPPQSHPALFNYWAHSINFMLLTQWEHIKVYWIKRRRGSISRWLMQTSDSVQSLSAKPHRSASLLYTKCHLCLKRGYFTSFITFVAKTCYQSALTETIRWFTIKNKLFFLG